MRAFVSVELYRPEDEETFVAVNEIEEVRPYFHNGDETSFVYLSSGRELWVAGRWAEVLDAIARAEKEST